MKWRWWRTADQMAADFSANRIPEENEKFIADCGLPDTLLARRVAIAVRRSVANYGMIESNFIRADDVYPDELIELSGWESIDFVDWVLELERELEIDIPILDGVFENIGQSFSVSELAGTIYTVLEQLEKAGSRSRNEH